MGEELQLSDKIDMQNKLLSMLLNVNMCFDRTFTTEDLCLILICFDVLYSLCQIYFLFLYCSLLDISNAYDFLSAVCILLFTLHLEWV